MIQVKELLVITQKESVAQAREATISDMMKHLKEVRSSVESKLNHSMVILQRGMEESEKEQRTREEKLETKMTTLSEKVVHIQTTQTETNAMFEDMDESMNQIKETVEIEKKQHAEHKKEVA